MNNLLKYKLIGEIVALAVIVNEKTPATVFVDFSGHVEWVNIRIYSNGWKESKEAEIGETVYVSKEDDKSTKLQLKQLQKIKNTLSKMCIKGAVDLSVLPYEIKTIKVKYWSLTEEGAE